MSSSISQSITVAAPPTVADVAADMSATMAAQSGVQTDFNPGSQYRTNAEALGSVIDMQGIIAQAMAFQALVYSAFAAFKVFPAGAVPAIGQVTFSTSATGTPPPAVASVNISAGTLVSTVGGVQFVTTANATLAIGTTAVTVPIEAAVAGVNGNVAGGSITQIVTGLPYPLFVSNSLPTAGGIDAETAAQTLARFTAVVASLGLSTPVALANAAIGVTASGTAETVRYATVYEPWIAMGLTGSAGFQLFIDNGAGSASSALIAAVKTLIDGNQLLGLDGYRPAGVPYSVDEVIPLTSSVVVSGMAIAASQATSLEQSAAAAISGYYASLQFGNPAELTQIVATVANSVAYALSSLQVWLLDSSGAQQQVVTPLPYGRMILSNSDVVFV